MRWQPDQDARLTQLWRDGLSVNSIAQKMRISRNAVIGRAHRLGLPARKSPIARNGAAPHNFGKGKNVERHDHARRMEQSRRWLAQPLDAQREAYGI